MKNLLFVLIFCFVFIFSAFSETITLTTYYPAPFGVYNEIRAKRMAIGDNYYNKGAYPWVTGVPVGNEINEQADLVVEGKVGIGTHVLEGNPANPYPLTVLNRMAIRNEEPGTGDYLLWLYDTDLNSGFTIGIDNDHPNYMRLRPAFNAGTLITGQNDAIGVSVTSGDPVGQPSNPPKYVNVGIGWKADPLSSDERLQVFGNIKVTGGIKIGDYATCNNRKRGTLRYHGNRVQFCSPTGWQNVGGGAAGGGFSVGDCDYGGCGAGFANPGYHGYGACEMPNLLTGSCTCPAGYTRQLIAEVGEPYPSWWDAIYVCVQ